MTVPSKHITVVPSLQVAGRVRYSGVVSVIRVFILLGLVTVVVPAQYRRGRQQDINAPVERMPADFEGSVRGVTSKELVIETADGNTLQFRLTRKTEYYTGKQKSKASAVEVGMHAKVEGRKAPDNSLDAVRVEVSK